MTKPTLKLYKTYDHGRCANLDCRVLLEWPIQTITLGLTVYVPGDGEVETTQETRKVPLCRACFEKFNKQTGFHVELISPEDV